MLISFRNNIKLNSICLYFLVITTLIGSMVYLGFASLYHFYIVGLLIVILYKGIHTGMLRTDIMAFLIIWLFEAIISTIWAPDKMLALKYSYYIFLITGICILFHYFLTKDNLEQFSCFMVILLFICNLIAFWEMRTGNHLVKDYLSNPRTAHLIKYVPGGFYMNSNDFATYIIQIIPFSFAGVCSPKKPIRVISMFNLVASFVTICATQSRTQIILLLLLYVFFAIVIRKKELIKLGIFVLVMAVLLYYIYPKFHSLIDNALDSVSGKTLLSGEMLESESISTRINLLKNAGYILIDTFGFGVGAGCHRSVMAAYSAMYYNTDRALDMHNLLGEIFVDYGVMIGILFLAAIINSSRKLYCIYKKSEAYHIRVLTIMLFCSHVMFILCGMSSSSILQLSSVWLVFCFTSAFVKCCSKNDMKS